MPVKYLINTELDTFMTYHLQAHKGESMTGYEKIVEGLNGFGFVKLTDPFWVIFPNLLE